MVGLVCGLTRRRLGVVGVVLGGLLACLPPSGHEPEDAYGQEGQSYERLVRGEDLDIAQDDEERSEDEWGFIAHNGPLRRWQRRVLVRLGLVRRRVLCVPGRRAV